MYNKINQCEPIFALLALLDRQTIILIVLQARSVALSTKSGEIYYISDYIIILPE